MGAATLLIFVSVVHRFGTGVSFLYPYFIQIHIAWAQELCIYLFIWMAKFGAAYGVRTGIHVGVDVLVRLLSPSKRRFWITFDLLAGAFFTGVIALLRGRFVFRILGNAQCSPEIQLPIWVSLS